MERSHEYHPNQRYSATLPDTGTTPGDLISSVRFRAGVPESPIWKIATMLHFSAPCRTHSTVTICVCSKPWKSDAHFVRFQLPLALTRRIKNLQKCRLNSRLQPDYSIPPHRTLRSDITAAPFHARRTNLTAPEQMHCQNLRPLYCDLERFKRYQFN